VNRGPLHVGFILEREYRLSRMPSAVAAQLERAGHTATIIEPSVELAGVAGPSEPRFDAVVLRTVSGGPGISLLEAFAAAGVRTVNEAAAVRRVRDKVVMAATARASGIPFPETFFAAEGRLLEQVPADRFPLVVKPSVGGFGRSVRLVRSADELAALCGGDGARNLLAQPWVRNPGHDIKLYNTGEAIHAVRRRSSLLGGLDGEREPVSAGEDLRELARRVGEAFGLDVYGADVVESGDGWVVVDVNDFPSFGTIANAPAEIAATVVRIASRGRDER
jgi:ribosomal protein S6--L-glutamate ligase